MKEQKLRIVSGIRATGKLHVGNYLGALKQFVELQDTSSERFYFIADLHALTTPFDPKSLKGDTLEVAAEYLAAGIDPSRTTLFLQNHIAEHATLAWIFNCLVPLPELERMTQFKDKSSQHKKDITAGLLTYPNLMAADILLYKPDAVPVGEDQLQHLELTRIIARKFNNRFGKTFPEPKAHAQKPIRVMSLRKPEKKMSKTGDEPLYISDPPKIISEKIKKAVTTSTPNTVSPSTMNLLNLLQTFSTAEQSLYFEKEAQSGTLKFSELKQELTAAITEHFAEFRERKKEIISDKSYIAQVLGEGAHKASQVAKQTLQEVKEKIGLI